MIKLIIKNINLPYPQYSWDTIKENIEKANEFIDINKHLFGKSERWILQNSEPYEPSDVLQTEERISDNTGESTSWVLLKADYTIEIIDLDQDYEWLLSECHRKRREEYPPLSELGDALYWKENGDPSKYDLYIKKCDEVKKKYPLPLKKEII